MAEAHTRRLSTGTTGLDTLLNGGFPPGRIYLVHGDAGTGKTTLGLQFLMAAAAAGKRCLCVTLLQTLSELREIISSHDWDVDGVTLVELPREVRDAASQGQTVFSPADVELSEVSDAIEAAIEEHDPECLFIDSLSELGVLVDNGYQLRRQVLRLKQTLDERGCTTILSAGPAGILDTATVETLVHGVIGLEMAAPSLGQPRRRVLITKMRGMSFRGGYHDAEIVKGGLHVYPRILVPPIRSVASSSQIPSGNEQIDALLGGGLEKGTTCVITGTSGAGKSTLSTHYSYAAGKRGGRSAVFCFDERIDTLMRRSAGLGMPLEQLVSDDVVAFHQINVGEISPGRFGHMVQQAVEHDGAEIIVLDSLSGYLQSMPGEQELITQLHELLGYLSQAGVLTLMVVATHGLFGESASPIDVSYIADTVVLLRHFEARSEVRRCIAVQKKRYGDHEHTIRELKMGPYGLRVSEPLTAFSGLLTGLPRYDGDANELLSRDRRDREGSES